MRLIEITKSTAVTTPFKKSKFFTDSLVAAFSARAANLKTSMEPYTVLQDGEKYYDIQQKKPADLHYQCRDFTKNQAYFGGYVTERGSDFSGGGASYDDYLVLSLPVNDLDTAGEKFFLAADGSLYLIGKQIPIEEPRPEYLQVEPGLKEAVQKASSNIDAEQKQKLKLFSEESAQVELRKRELKELEASLQAKQHELQSEGVSVPKVNR